MKSQQIAIVRGLHRGTSFSLLALLSFLVVCSWSSPAEAQSRRSIRAGSRQSEHHPGARRAPVDVTCNENSCGVPTRATPTRRRAPVTACGCQQVWVPGHYEIRKRAVRDPGCTERVWVPARYQTTFCGGRRVSVKVSDGYYKNVFRPGKVRYVKHRVFVPGHYQANHRCHDRARPHRRGGFVRIR